MATAKPYQMREAILRWLDDPNYPSAMAQAFRAIRDGGWIEIGPLSQQLRSSPTTISMAMRYLKEGAGLDFVAERIPHTNISRFRLTEPIQPGWEPQLPTEAPTSSRRGKGGPRRYRKAQRAPETAPEAQRAAVAEVVAQLPSQPPAIHPELGEWLQVRALALTDDGSFAFQLTNAAGRSWRVDLSGFVGANGEG